jgi:hypothetical protein
MQPEINNRDFKLLNKITLPSVNNPRIKENISSLLEKYFIFVVAISLIIIVSLILFLIQNLKPNIITNTTNNLTPFLVIEDTPTKAVIKEVITPPDTSPYPLPTNYPSRQFINELKIHPSDTTVNPPEEFTLYLGTFKSLPVLFYTNPKRHYYYDSEINDNKESPYIGMIAFTQGDYYDSVDFRLVNNPKIIYQDKEKLLFAAASFTYSNDKNFLYVIGSFTSNNKEKFGLGYSQVFKLNLVTNEKTNMWPKVESEFSPNPLTIIENKGDKYLLLTRRNCSWGMGVECEPIKFGNYIVLNLNTGRTLELPGSYTDIKILSDKGIYEYKDQEYKEVYVGKECFDRCSNSGCIIDSDFYECEANGYAHIWVTLDDKMTDKLP